MEIAVVVPEETYWNAFITDLSDLWVLEHRRHFREVILGKIRYRMLSLSSPLDRHRGVRYDQLWIYNCHHVPQEIYYYFLYPRVESGFPTRQQAKEYGSWFMQIPNSLKRREAVP